jgi:hypothetical protein
VFSKHAKSGIDPVNRFALLDNLLDPTAGRLNRLFRLRRKGNRRAITGNGNNVFNGEMTAVNNDLVQRCSPWLKKE